MAIEEVEIKLLSLNVFCRPPGIKTNKDDFKDERLELIASEACAAKFDIVAFQELFKFGSNRQDYVIHKAKKLGFKHSHTSSFGDDDVPTGSDTAEKSIQEHQPKSVVSLCSSSLYSVVKGVFSGRIIDGGLTIISKYEIVKRDGIAFSKGCGVDGFCQKGVIYTLIKLPHKSKEFYLHLFTTHTQASYNTHLEKQNPNLNVNNDKARNVQLEELGAFIASKLSEDEQKYPAFLVGDLNVDGRTSHAVLGNVLTDAERELNKSLSERNRGTHSKMYLSMLERIQSGLDRGSAKLKMRDVLFEKLQEHPVTVCDVTVDENGIATPTEIHLHDRQVLGQTKSLDYIFQIEHEEKAQHYSVSIVSAQAELCTVENQSFTHLSDHYGVYATIKFSVS